MHGRVPGGLKSFVTVLLALPLALLYGCESQAPYTADTFVMGTQAWVTLYGYGEKEAEPIAAEALRELHRIEAVMSTWRPASEISRLNGAADGTMRTVSRELFTVVDSAFYYAAVTGGAFDITARPLVRLWGFQGGEPRLPSEDEIAGALERVGYGRVALDASMPGIALPAGMELDLAGIAKGYAVDRCVALLAERGVTSALVNLGGNIYALGAPPGKRGWTIGIRDPHGGLSTVGALTLKDAAVATSGNYENFVEIEGARYGHIIDPHTGRTVDHVLSVTVVAPTALASDALSTGLFVLGGGRGSDLVRRLSGVRALFAEPADGRIMYRTAGDFGDALELDGEIVQAQ
ncbi:MAG TPA: FAD:protein FMN transferase [Patescibacteria group bacterium]|nr:FAD:protein FMN transferase [Patescibacteria group bacterium]